MILLLFIECQNFIREQRTLLDRYNLGLLPNCSLLVNMKTCEQECRLCSISNRNVTTVLVTGHASLLRVYSGKTPCDMSAVEVQGESTTFLVHISYH